MEENNASEAYSQNCPGLSSKGLGQGLREKKSSELRLPGVSGRNGGLEKVCVEGRDLLLKPLPQSEWAAPGFYGCHTTL